MRISVLRAYLKKATFFPHAAYFAIPISKELKDFNDEITNYSQLDYSVMDYLLRMEPVKESSKHHHNDK